MGARIRSCRNIIFLVDTPQADRIFCGSPFGFDLLSYVRLPYVAPRTLDGINLDVLNVALLYSPFHHVRVKSSHNVSCFPYQRCATISHIRAQRYAATLDGIYIGRVVLQL